jgi:DNA-binding NarL/FixJ family response regulator
MKTKELVRVMIVEDQPIFQELAELVLSLDPQFEIVRIAGTGEEALQVLEEANPDLILLDFRLPGIDGLETYLELMGWKRRNALRSITPTSPSAWSLLIRRRFWLGWPRRPR